MFSCVTKHWKYHDLGSLVKSCMVTSVVWATEVTIWINISSDLLYGQLSVLQNYIKRILFSSEYKLVASIAGMLLEKEMACHSNILAWRIQWTEEPGGLQSIGSHRVVRTWLQWLSTYTLECSWGPKNRGMRFKLHHFNLNSYNLKKIIWVQ